VDAILAPESDTVRVVLEDLGEGRCGLDLFVIVRVKADIQEIGLMRYGPLIWLASKQVV